MSVYLWLVVDAEDMDGELHNGRCIIQTCPTPKALAAAMTALARASVAWLEKWNLPIGKGHSVSIRSTLTLPESRRAFLDQWTEQGRELPVVSCPTLHAPKGGDCNG